MRIENYLIELKNRGFYPKSILDIGANVGEFGKFCKNLFPTSNILMIEGNDNCESDLKMTGLNYKICLLGDTKRKVQFHLNPENNKCTGSSYYKEVTHHYNQSVIVEKELQLLDEVNQNSFDLIKIDTQGSELDIIKGGLETIKKAKYVILEAPVKEYNIGSPKLDEIITFMQSIGFKEYEEIEKHHWHSPNKEFEYGEVFQIDLSFKNSNI